MLKILVFAILPLFALVCPITSHTQSLHWANVYGGSSVEGGHAVTTDADGNVYTVGGFTLNVDFDPGPGVYNLDGGFNFDVFVMKSDANGEFIWTKNFPNEENAIGFSVAVDQDGNVYTAGTVHGVTDFDPGPGVHNLGSSSGEFTFLSKLDSNGNLAWAKLFGASATDIAYAITLDADQNVYMTGMFADKVDFDPGPGTANLTSPGPRSSYVLKLNPAGEFQWVKMFGGAGSVIGWCLEISPAGDIYMAGSFSGTADFDPGLNEISLSSAGLTDAFVTKLNAQGELIWAQRFGGSQHDAVSDIALCDNGDIALIGDFEGTVDFDPGASSVALSAKGLEDAYVVRWNADAQLIWARRMGGTGSDTGIELVVDGDNNVYATGSYEDEFYINAGIDAFYFNANGLKDAFMVKFDINGHVVWAHSFGDTGADEIWGCHLSGTQDFYITGLFEKTIDFDPGTGNVNITSHGGKDIFTARYFGSGISGNIFHDQNVNCHRDGNENGLQDRFALIKPGNVIVRTNESGYWYTKPLPVGEYTITYDTFGWWTPTCPSIQHFMVTNPDSLISIPGFGMLTTRPCASPEISIYTPILRRCFSDQLVYIDVCNLPSATSHAENVYVVIYLDPTMSIGGSSIPYTSLGNAQYQVDIGTLEIGACVNFTFSISVSCEAALGQTFCLEAEFFPADSCTIMTGETLNAPDQPCEFEADASHLTLAAQCENDSMIFTITNTSPPGSGDMKCFAPVHSYVDAEYMWRDSIRLNGGESKEISFAGDGRTWRLEVEQHPNHIGRSQPNATIERCGGLRNWTPDLWNTLGDDDADPVTAIFCDIIRGSFDPNDKTGFPTGVGSAKSLVPNGKLEYVVRFQNTGNDTAFQVIIRDTIDEDLDLFTIRPGVSSHANDLRIMGPGVLEWTFNNILLPDSTTDLVGSQGFVTFSIDQKRNLPDGTEIKNSASIYFDFNEPIQTNSTLHTIDRGILYADWAADKFIMLEDCDSIVFHGFVYTRSGHYFQIVEGGMQPDTLVTLEVSILKNETFTTVDVNESTLSAVTDDASYQWMDCASQLPIPEATGQSFSPNSSGLYGLIISQNGCVDTSDCHEVIIVHATNPERLHRIKLFPNPASDVVTLELDDASDVSIVVTDMFGRELDRQTQDLSSLIKIPLPYGPGIYFIIVKTQEGRYTGRVVKN